MAPIALNDLEEYYPSPFPKNVPTIQLEKISVQKLLDGEEETAQKLFHVCCNEGFFYLDLTTDPRGQQFLEEANQLHQVAKHVFNNVPMEQKLEYKPGNPLKEHLDYGYKCMTTDEHGQPDKAEFLNISTHRLLYESEQYPLPTWLSSQEDLYRSFIKNGNAIGHILLTVLQRELHLAPGQLTDMHRLEDPSGDFLRLFRYPAPKDGQPHKAPPGPAHTDATSITMLFNWQGGLQITRPKERKVELIDRDYTNEEWLYVKPEPGHVIVNLGDSMVVFTNGLLKSGRHRVVTPPGAQGLHHRYSVLTNLRPANDTPMRALSSDVIPVTNEKDDKPTITALDWSLAKVKAILERMK